MSRSILAHPQERRTVIYSMWYNVPRLLSVGGPECGGKNYVFGVKEVLAAALRVSDRQLSGDIIPHAVNQSCAPEDGQELPETC